MVRDSQYIYFGLGSPEGDSMVRIRITDSKLGEIKSLKDMQRLFGFRLAGYFGNWWDLAPDDSPLVLRNAATQEIYTLDVDLP